MITNNNDNITRALSALRTQTLDLHTYYDYYEGRHKLNFASRKFRNKFGQRLQTLADNHCAPIIDATVNRLEIVNFYDPSKQIDSETLWALWTRNEMPAYERDLYREALRAGRAYLSVWMGQRGKAQIFIEDSRTIAEVYDQTDNLEFIAKRWISADLQRSFLNLYFPDRIERYEAESAQLESTFRPRAIDPIIENPYRQIPFFKLVYAKGASLLSHIIPLQDALNKQMCDLMVAGEYNSVRQRYATGLQLEIDEETNKPVIPFEYDEQLWATSSDTARFGEFSDTALEQYIAAKRDVREEIAFITGIPLHYLNSDANAFPSGEALRRAEGRFIAMLQEVQRKFSPPIGAAMRFAVLIDQKASAAEISDGLYKTDRIEIEWQDGAPISLTEQLQQALIKKELGIPLSKILEDLGYTDAEIQNILSQKTAEEATRVANAQQAFDAGVLIA